MPSVSQRTNLNINTLNISLKYCHIMRDNLHILNLIIITVIRVSDGNE